MDLKDVSTQSAEIRSRYHDLESTAFYRTENDFVYIVRIIFGRRDYLKILLD